MLRFQIVLSALVISVWGGAARAETGPLGFGPAQARGELVSDRPDFTESPATITPGHFQLEGGYEYAKTRESGRNLEAHAAPLFLLRTGILDDLELRLLWGGYARDEAPGDSGKERFEGTVDFAVEVKHFLYEQEGLRPDIAILLGLSFPTGSGDMRGDDIQPVMKFLWAYDLGELYAIGGNVNLESPVEDDERYLETAASLALGRSLGKSLAAYIEYFAFFPNRDAPETSSEHFINGGFTFAVHENLQLDAYVGTGLGDETSDIFVGTGFAWRH